MRVVWERFILDSEAITAKPDIVIPLPFLHLQYLQCLAMISTNWQLPSREFFLETPVRLPTLTKLLTNLMHTT